ncbi:MULTISPECIES: hypothetical protein [Actinoalloteichus]|uniref:Uncharacterized protein n=1 Tax=Actinoalloteichus fjordicus TaxID=1612552 RepID=A0AAC9LD80_9PSEU|nr:MULTISPECIES: hypothetical protein [Actinoalloteichus]APU15176.1 hypothetical protein UA74_15620 [Actinoalloteichus fjordicus]APU21245.1 hypothetical protein UA75_16185 [Actinoalloteichus sp. GBA129-24]
MTALTLTPIEVMAGLGVLIAFASVWRAGARRARVAAEKAQTGGRLLSLTGRVLFNAGLIVAVQWVVMSSRVHDGVVLAALAVPALFAAYSLTRALTVTTKDLPRRRGGRR